MTARTHEPAASPHRVRSSRLRRHPLSTLQFAPRSEGTHIGRSVRPARGGVTHLGTQKIAAGSSDATRVGGCRASKSRRGRPSPDRTALYDIALGLWQPDETG